jgi:hypothetical protein
MVSNFLIILCSSWKIHLLGLSSDEVRNMTKHVVGVMIRLQDSMHDDYALFRIWCRTHQFNLVMEHIMNEVVK